MSQSIKVQFLPEDPDRLFRLCGPINSNLKQIEETLKVKISNRGSNFNVKGQKEGIETGKKVLEGLYERSENKKDILPEEVHLYLVEAMNNKNKKKKNKGKAHTPTKMNINTPKTIVIPKGENQELYVNTIRKKTLTFGVGPAGTGKTYLAVAVAVQYLINREVERILLVRPAVEAGERLGFLPGDLSQKIDPYLRPLYDALFEMLGFKEATKLIDRNIIEVVPLAFMRGRTLNKSFIILDESQNATEEQMKMFLTRFGFGSSVVVTGDITQIDLPKSTVSGLIHTMDVLKGMKEIGFINFGTNDVVRHGLVKKIVEAYERYD
ncbi:uncharacterized protein METZ01_LOCUS118402 [marine metagenome]|uniref:PhoH-like protein n=1 Tax=marine metagenome TaxID=408172 RepID=A0A381XLD3_9ZZZZ